MDNRRRASVTRKAIDKQRLSSRRASSSLEAGRVSSAQDRSLRPQRSDVVVGVETLNDVADIVPVPIWTMDLDGFVTYGNAAWMAATGGNGVERNVIWTDACHPEDRGLAVAAFRAAIASRENLDVEVRLKASDGTYRWSSLIAVPHYDPNGRLTRYVCVSSDASAKYRTEQVVRRLAANFVRAQESERSRIARELHDDLGQRLALLAAKMTPAEDRCGAAFKDAHEQLRDITAAVHSLSNRLHPGKLRLIGLVKTLESLCEDVSRAYGLHVGFCADGPLSDVTGDAALCLFRVTQEALQNAVLHSGAATIRVDIARDGMWVRLQVIDDGRGFQPPAAELQLSAEPSDGLGLLTMRERVELIRGTLTIQTAPGRGTTIEAIIPAYRL
jgi:PAS domain S-box-containing protein